MAAPLDHVRVQTTISKKLTKKLLKNNNEILLLFVI